MKFNNMKNIILFILTLCPFVIYGQCPTNVGDPDFGTALNCHNNIFDTPWALNNADLIRATFKYNRINDGGLTDRGNDCTGVLINQAVSQGNLRQLFLTATHCISEADFEGEDWLFFFNYQSPDALNASVPINNQGWHNINQTATPLQSDIINNCGYQYAHTSQVRLIKKGVWTDIALCEIITPIPPHFNVHYVGWDPFILTDILSNNVYHAPIRIIHHPRGDIKKGSDAGTIDPILWNIPPEVTFPSGVDFNGNGLEVFINENDININILGLGRTGIAAFFAAIGIPLDVYSASCGFVTDALDGVLSIFDVNIGIGVVCNIPSLPHFYTNWDNGTAETGSSGSPVFNQNGDLIGILSWSPEASRDFFQNVNACQWPASGFGKFGLFFNNASVRDALNPSVDFSVMLFGHGGRTINCYENLDDLNGQYFPAEDYQPDNHIILQSDDKISNDGELRIYNRANYSFIGQDIELVDGFEVEAGATFTAELNNGCLIAPRTIPTERELWEQITAIELPDEMEFNIENYLDNNILDNGDNTETIFVVEGHPNPTTNYFNIVFTLEQTSNIDLKVYDSVGKIQDNILAKKKFRKGLHHYTIDMASYKNGVYFIQVETEFTKKVLQVIKQ